MSSSRQIAKYIDFTIKWEPDGTKSSDVVIHQETPTKQRVGDRELDVVSTAGSLTKTGLKEEAYQF